VSVRTTVTLDDDVAERVKAESKSRGASFRHTLNELVRLGLATQGKQAERPPFKVKPRHTGAPPAGVNLDCTEALIEWAEGPWHR
jgi:hypothetical protein